MLYKCNCAQSQTNPVQAFSWGVKRAGVGGVFALEHFYIVDSYISLFLSVSMERSPSWGANMSSANQQIPHILRNLQCLLPHSQVPATCPYPAQLHLSQQQ